MPVHATTTRLAPTPSGYLHRGNVVNFLLVKRLSLELGAEVALRIDDADTARYRREYVDDIFAVLDWVGIRHDHGPRSTIDLESRFSQRLRTEHYRDALRHAAENGLNVFACRCSRAQMAGGPGGCVGSCREDADAVRAGESAARVDTPFGDVVLWRRDDLPGYQLTSIVDDRDLGITHIVRGMDLRRSSEVQRHLAPHFGATTLANAVYLHHELVTEHGVKLSKSQLSGGPISRSTDMLKLVQEVASRTELQ
jgi:glutamyl/glutaminyl-tRNA synthetase